MIEFPPSFAVGGGTLLLARGNQGDLSEWSLSEILPLFCVGGGGFSSQTLSPFYSLSVHDRIILFFCCLGGWASAREGKPFSERDRILPLFCSVGGGGFCSRGEAFSSHDKLLPLFCSMGGEASTCEGKQRRLLRASVGGGATTRTQQSTSTGFFFCLIFVLHFQGSSFQHQHIP